ncbi:MAG TPA: MinD/ParA family protein, partial [Hyphomicrobiales bacterium]|nr:MinD/ParA family protein [Hyphomicrobiales bacterium]
VVVCDEPASLTDAYALIKVLGQEHGVRRFQVIGNMVQDAAHGRQLYGKLSRVAEHYLADVALGYLGAVPFDERLKQAVRQQRALMQQSPYSASGLAFQQLAERITALPRQTAPGYFEFFANRCERGAPAMGRTA